MGISYEKGTDIGRILEFWRLLFIYALVSNQLYLDKRNIFS